MAKIEPQGAFYIRARYLGPTDTKPARFAISWEGWPSDNSRTVRRVVAWQEGAALAETAARLFCEWLSAGFADEEQPPTYTPKAIIYASAAPDQWAIMVQATDSRGA